MSMIPTFVHESLSEVVDSSSTVNADWSWVNEPVGISKDDSFMKLGLLEQINTTADKSDYLWYSLRYTSNLLAAFPYSHCCPNLTGKGCQYDWSNLILVLFLAALISLGRSPSLKMVLKQFFMLNHLAMLFMLLSTRSLQVFLIHDDLHDKMEWQL